MLNRINTLILRGIKDLKDKISSLGAFKRVSRVLVGDSDYITVVMLDDDTSKVLNGLGSGDYKSYISLEVRDNEDYEYFSYDLSKYKVRVCTSDGFIGTYVNCSDALDIMSLAIDKLGLRGNKNEYDIANFVEYVSRDMFNGCFKLVDVSIIDIDNITYRDIQALNIFEDNVYSLPCLYSLRESILREYATMECVLERIDRAIIDKRKSMGFNADEKLCIVE